MNTAFNKSNDSFLTEIKEIVTKRLDEERKKAAVPYEENYKKLVNEAVLVIKDQWETYAKYCVDVKQVIDSVTLEAINAFYITKDDLELVSNKGHGIINPDTGTYCFRTEFKFRSEEDVKQYLLDVKSFLPENTSCVANMISENALGSQRTNYTFNLKLDV